MRTWRLAWILQTLRYRPCFHILFLMVAVGLACNDMTPEQINANVNCSSPERHTRSYTHLEGGDVRKTKLFCSTQWYLRIDKEGNVTGTTETNNVYSILEIRTVGVGVVVIKGVESEYYLAMNKSGRLYTKKLTNDDCNFEELILENNYNAYASAKWRNTGKRMFIALNNKGMPVKGKRSKKGQKASHFLPMRLSNKT